MNFIPSLSLSNIDMKPLPHSQIEISIGGGGSMMRRMSRSTERCSCCGQPLAVPQFGRTTTMRCSACGTVTGVRGSSSGDSTTVRQAAGWIKGKIKSSLGSFSSFHWERSTSSPTSSYRWSGSSSVPREVINDPTSVHGKKRAVLCGVSYVGRAYELGGTVNDVNCMRYLLRERFGFPDESIIILTEEETDRLRIPTKENMRAAMQWLVRGCRPGDSLVFHFSGHGTQKLDITGDDADGFDEALCPLDYESSGTILDDEINATIVRPLPAGVKLHAVVDACHSGTALDLPFLCRMNSGGFFQWEDHRPPSGTYTGTNGGLVICFSGCDDNQTSADTSALSNSVSTGAMTYSFIHALETEPGLTYGRMLSDMRSLIRGAETSIRINGPIASLINKVFNRGLKQEPQLSSSETFDVYKKPFLL